MPISRYQAQGKTDPILSAFAVDYANRQEDFIGDKLFPVVPVKNEQGTYYTWTSTKDKFTLPNATIRAASTGYMRGTLNVGTGTYATQENGWEIAVDKRLQDNAIAPYDPWKSAVEQAAAVVLIRREYDVLRAATNSTTFASYTAALAAADRFDTLTSDPVGLIDTYMGTVASACGLLPNVAVLGWDAWVKLKEHPVITDKMKVTDDRIATPQIVARILGLEKLYVSKARYNSAQEGQTPSLAQIFPTKTFALYYVNPSPAIDMPSCGYLIQKHGFIADSYYEDQTRSDIARARTNEVGKIVAADCGYVLTTVIA